MKKLRVKNKNRFRLFILGLGIATAGTIYSIGYISSNCMYKDNNEDLKIEGLEDYEDIIKEYINEEEKIIDSKEYNQIENIVYIYNRATKLFDYNQNIIERDKEFDKKNSAEKLFSNIFNNKENKFSRGEFSAYLTGHTMSEGFAEYVKRFLEYEDYEVKEINCVFTPRKGYENLQLQSKKILKVEVNGKYYNLDTSIDYNGDITDINNILVSDDSLKKMYDKKGYDVKFLNNNDLEADMDYDREIVQKAVDNIKIDKMIFENNSMITNVEKNEELYKEMSSIKSKILNRIQTLNVKDIENSTDLKEILTKIYEIDEFENYEQVYNKICDELKAEDIQDFDYYKNKIINDSLNEVNSKTILLDDFIRYVDVLDDNKHMLITQEDGVQYVVPIDISDEYIIDSDLFMENNKINIDNEEETDIEMNSDMK